MESGDLPSSQNIPRLAILFEGGLVVLAVALGWLFGFPPADLIQWRWQAVALGAAASVPLVLLLVAGDWVPFLRLASLERIIDKLLVPLFRRCTILEFAIISLLAGLGEEMLFRGLLQEGLSRWWGGDIGPWLALVVASLLFGIMHAVTPAYALLATAIGLFLGWLWIETGNLLVPITTHAVYDFLALVYMVRLRKAPEGE